MAAPRRVENRNAVLDALRAYVTAHGYAPTVAELRTATGLASNSSVVYQLDRLADEGVIRRAPATARGIVLLDPGDGA